MSAPARLGPYQVLRVLGEGGMGVVYAVQDPLAPRALALKVIRSRDADAVALERFQREADVLSRVRHRSVVRVHKTGRLPEGPFLLQDLVEGEPLAARLARGPLEPRDAARLVRELADALAAAHAAGVLHRDLKPGNVLVQPDGIPVLLDFGLARDLGARRLTHTGQSVGTPSYMAPEQAGGDSPSTFGPALDVYGLGAVLYEALVGRPPFDEGSPMATMKAVLTREPEWPGAARPEVPAALDAIVRRALAKRPEERQPGAAALRDELDRFLEGARATRRARGGRPGLGLAAAVGVGLAAAAGAAALLLRRGSAPPAPAPTPATAAVPSRAAPARPGPAPQEAPAWRLAPGDALAYRYRIEEDDGRVRVVLELGLEGRVEAVDGERAALALTITEVEASCGASGEGVGAQGAIGGCRYASRAGTDPDDPLATVLGHLAGAPLRLVLSTATGALLELAGAAPLAKRARAAPVDREQLGGLRLDGYYGAALDEPALAGTLDGLLRVRGGPVERRQRDAAAPHVVRRGPPAGLVIDTLISPAGADATSRLSGEARYQGGRLAASTLVEEVTGGLAEDVPQRTTLRASLVARSP